MSELLHLEVVTPQRRILATEVTEVRLPGSLGELGVLPGHTPLLTTLGVGPLTTFNAQGTEVMAVFGGFAEVLPDRVTVLATGAEQKADIDVAAARSERDEVTEAMKGASAEEVEEMSRRLQMAEVRLRVAGDEGH